MSLYLCVFDDDKEIDGVEVGGYDDFNAFRMTVVNRLEGGNLGSKFPTLILHSDCDGEWTAEQCVDLERELGAIETAFREMPPVELHSDWQKAVGSSLCLHPKSLYESFIDVDGEPLLERLSKLCRLSQETGEPILFQ